VTIGDRDRGDPTYRIDKDKGDMLRGPTIPPKLVSTFAFEFLWGSILCQNGLRKLEIEPTTSSWIRSIDL
jgi:hypothetical protein